MGVFEELAGREFIYKVTDPGLAKILNEEKVVFYAGFDPTADSLHIGNLLVIMGMVHLQRAGHRPVGLCGGGTGLIGDPSGKSKERPLLQIEDMERNLRGIRAQLERFLDFSPGPSQAIMANNLDWLGKLNLIEFIATPASISGWRDDRARVGQAAAGQRRGHELHGILLPAHAGV